MTILVTGAAGFIGFNTAKALLNRGETVLGLDCLNNYYDVNLKMARLKILEAFPDFKFIKLDISEEKPLKDMFQNNPQITRIVHLAAQAGVRYSLTHPFAYIDSNIRGHLAMMEGAKILPHLKHMVYASSSSVYGANKKMPFSIDDRTDHPISLYAATKKTCELMSQCYAHLFELPLTGLRFFTVYGPWGRPDMSAFIFTKAILDNTEMPVFNHGNMRRNFTFIDDIVAGAIGCLDRPPLNPSEHRVYNIGNDRSEPLMDFIEALETHLGKKARIRFEPMQPGDVPETIADIEASHRDFGFAPKTNMVEGLGHFVDWYQDYYQTRS